MVLMRVLLRFSSSFLVLLKRVFAVVVLLGFYSFEMEMVCCFLEEEVFSRVCFVSRHFLFWEPQRFPGRPTLC